MKNDSVNNYFNLTFQSNKFAQSRQLFLLTGLTLFTTAIIQRIARPAMFMLLSLILPLASVGMLYAQFKPPIAASQKIENIFLSKTENIISYNLANRLTALTQSPISYGIYNNSMMNQPAVNLSVASTFTVTNTSDSGAGSLRQAIINANSDPDVSSIVFNIDATAPYTISLQSGLPYITATAIVDASTQPGFNGQPLVEINGAGAVNADGFGLAADNCVFKGFVINRFDRHALYVARNNNIVAGNYIGTNLTGTAALPVAFSGILVGGSNNTIGGTTALERNVISGNGHQGIAIAGSGNNIKGNYIGANAAGTAALGGGGIFMFAGASNNIIGGSETGARNIISGNSRAGISIGTFGSAGATGNIIQGNYIGTNASGTAALQNNGDGVVLSEVSGNIIGGSGAGQGNIISGNQFSGIALHNNSTNNQILGNRIGTNVAGTAAIANLFEGVHLNNSSNNIIGGSAAGQGNLISGNGRQGVGVFGNSANTQLKGNRIGTNAAGTTAIANVFNGIAVDSSSGNVIGGTEAGARNVVSGNGSSGISVYNNSANNQIIGNYSGTNAEGTAAVPNFYDGIVIVNSNGNVIGGTQSGAGNLVSGNLSNGILIINIAANNQVIGNRVGTNAAGTTAIANVNTGIVVDNSSDNIIGGTEPGARNITSGNNGWGILLTNNSTNNRVLGNYAGVNAAGTAAIKNNLHGIYVANSSGNIIGGTEPGARNVTSGNRFGGIVLIDNATNNRVIGNYSGTNADGTAAIPNGFEGISVDNASGNFVGGTEPGEGNLFSGNTSQGVLIQRNSANNQILGNRIGINASGTAAVPNNATGLIINNSNGNIVGGTQAGAGNLISGNLNGGAAIFGSSTGNILQGNFIGTDVTGTVALGNIGNGVGISSPNNIIGGITPEARNIISGNSGSGVSIFGNAGNNQILGNYIGVNVAGNAAIRNSGYGVDIFDSSDNIIGGTNSGAKNLVSGNGIQGIVARGNSSRNKIQGNYVGTDFTGNSAIPNVNTGVALFDGATNNLIGGTEPGAGNLISGGLLGIYIGFVPNGRPIGTSVNNVIQGNLIGTNASGTAALGNTFGGIWVDRTPNTTIGGSVPQARNIISGNNNDGIRIFGVESVNNVIQGNFIGTGVGGESLGNLGNGILITNFTSNSVIGGNTAGDQNVIAFNSSHGVRINSGNGNAILSNSIYSNGGLGIFNQVNSNNNQVAPTISSAFVDGTTLVINGQLSNPPIALQTEGSESTGNSESAESAANTVYNIQFFSNTSCDPSGAGEGQNYLGSTSVTTDAFGNAAFSFTQAVLTGQIITATATDSNNNTSVFSQCRGLVNIGNCVYSLSSTNTTFAVIGTQSSTVNVITGGDCPWTAISNAPWITVTSGSSGTGDGTVVFAVAPYTGTERTGTITIAGQVFTVIQGAIYCPAIPIVYGQSINGSLSWENSCSVSGNPTDLYTFSGTQGQQIVISMDSAVASLDRTPQLQLVAPNEQIETRNGGALGVSARIPDSGFFTLTATGTYTIRASSLLYAARPGISSALSPQNLGSYTLSLSQRPTNPSLCTIYTPSPALTNVSPLGGTFFFDVLSDIGCPNVLASVGANNSHIHILSNIAGRVTFSVDSHSGQNERTGTIVVGGQTHTIKQFGVAPETNDVFAQAQTLLPFETCITPPGDPTTVVCPVEGHNTNATAEPNEPTHAGSAASRSVWYRWTAPGDGLYSFTTSGSTFDTVIAIYTGSSIGGLRLVAENDDTTIFDTTSKINFRATAGTVYYIAIDGKSGASGSIKLSYSHYRRLYRLYLQNFNGFPSPIIPTMVKAKRQDITGAEIVGKPISLGVYEFDLPDDNSPYIVTISGPEGITWQPSTYLIDNTAGRFGEMMDGAQGGGQNQQSNATFTTPVRFKGFIDNIRTQEMSSVNVHIASPGNSAAVAPVNRTNPPAPALPSPLVPFPNNRVRYDCQVQPNSDHSIIPSAPGKLFTASNLGIKINSDTSASDAAAFIMRASNATTFGISGKVLANGQGLDNVKIDLSGGSIAQKTSSGGGNYSFENLAPGNYTLTTSRSGFIFQNETVNLQSASVTRNINAQTCAYSFTGDNNFTAGGNPGKLNVKATISQQCEWTAQSDSDWITMNSNAFIGDNSIPFIVKPNNGSTRQGKIRVGEHDFTVTQADGCTFNVSPTGATTHPATGGTGGSFAVTPSNGNCAFTAESTDYCMVSLGRNNNGTINYEISKNTGVARSAVITIAGQSFTVNQEAAPGLHRAKFDFDGDGRADIAVFRPSNGTWYLMRSTEGFTGMQFGAAEDIPVAADYDGDGKTDIAVYRPSNGTWYLKRSRDGFTGFAFGEPTDIPQPADFDGDGKTDLAVWRPSNGTWYVFNLANNQFSFEQFGASTDQPVVGDYDGDGKANFAVFRPSVGFWYIARASGIASQNFDSFQFGAEGDKPVQADYDGDGKIDIAVYRPSNGTWYLRRSRDGFTGIQFGAAGDRPVAADYNGDSFADIAVFRPSTGQWFVWTCSDSRTNTPQLGGVYFGLSTDKTVQNPE